MKQIIFSIFLLLVLTTPFSVFAQESDLSKDDSRTLSDSEVSSLFEVDVSLGTQSVLNNTVPIIVDIKPHIDSSRAQVEFKIPGGFNRDTSSVISFEMKTDESRQFQFDLEPLDPGDYEIVVDVTAWRYDSNYVNSDEVSFSIDDNLLVAPVSKEYQNNKILLSVIVVVLSLSCSVGLFFLGRYLFNKYKHEFINDKKSQS